MTESTIFYNVAVAPLAGLLTYSPIEAASDLLEVGTFVEVPLGRRVAQGWILSTSSSAPTDFEARPVTKVLGTGPHFNEEQLKLFQWTAEYYGYPLSQVLEVAIPKSVQPQFEELAYPKETIDSHIKPGALQQKIIERCSLATMGIPVRELLQLGRGARTAIRRLEELGVLQITRTQRLDSHLEASSSAKPRSKQSDIALTPQQALAVEAVVKQSAKSQFEPYLLHGITGSGKTEVYIEAARAVLEAGRGVLIIVPEIALTPQLVDRFASRLGGRIALLHSAMPPRSRWDAWCALQAGRDRVAIGARSAVFAPVSNIGLIVVDEEHDGSFKQNDGLRYHARDLAVLRAKLNNCPVLLGSATPSLETYVNASRKRYKYLSLATRPGVALPPSISVVDMRKAAKESRPSPSLSLELHAALSDTIERGEQAFVLYNRRGFASYLQCACCGQVVSCPNCSVTLTLHQSRNTLMCHYCDFKSTAPQFCSACGPRNSKATSSSDNEKPTLEKRGAGTEKIFDELVELFPNVAAIRFDRDSIESVADYRRILADIRSEKYQLVVGTQLIAKGHDLPSVTLVGVIDCDIALHMPDFRASERAFQLLVQVSGRAGRSTLPGRVILQTHNPAHPAIALAQTQDYFAFAKLELAQRQVLGYPPHGKLSRIVISSQQQNEAFDAANRFANTVQKYIEGNNVAARLLGPAPAPISRIKAEYRFHFLIKSAAPGPQAAIIKFIQSTRNAFRGVKLIIDRDPLDML